VLTDTSQPMAKHIDSVISAEISDPTVDPLAYALVAEHMVHVPCGKLNPNSPCMKNGRCSKNYPKPFHDQTTIDENGYATCRCRNDGRFVLKGSIKLHNRWIVPYNTTLLKKYQAHINVEWCNKTIFVKYLFKYVTKGPDCSKIYLERVRNGEDIPFDEETSSRNEVKEYLDCRYICEQDACCRIFGFDIHKHYPAIEILHVHLPNENNVTYDSHANIECIMSDPIHRRTMLTSWFEANQIFEDSRELTYCDFPSKWRWDESSKTWVCGKRGEGKIGRIYYVHPSTGERYYLRMLLLIVKGACDYIDLRTYNNIVHQTFKEACNARGLLTNDEEWHNDFDEAASWATSNQLRQLFVTMLLHYHVSDEHTFFERVWKLLTDDIQYNF
jgi:hypothetical protein